MCVAAAAKEPLWEGVVTWRELAFFVHEKAMAPDTLESRYVSWLHEGEYEFRQTGQEMETVLNAFTPRT